MDDRQTFRANWYDYNEGLYFVTICSNDKRHIFGNITGGMMHISKLGLIVKDCIMAIPQHHNCEVWKYVIMPNHIHMILSIPPSSLRTQNITSDDINSGCLKPPKHGIALVDNHFNSALAIVVRTFKAAVTRSMRAQCIAPLPIWQRNYHEHIIRNRQSFENIMAYIDDNVNRWADDCYNN